MKFQLKLLTTALALSASASAFAIAGPGDDLGTLTEFPKQFLDYRLTDIQARGVAALAEGVVLGHNYSFTLGAAASVLGSVEGFLGSPTFSAVSLLSADDLSAVPVTLSFADLSEASFRFDGLAAGNYILTVEVTYPSGPQGYSGSVYATTPAVPEPQSLALLLAGLGVAGLVARRRHKA